MSTKYIIHVIDCVGDETFVVFSIVDLWALPIFEIVLYIVNILPVYYIFQKTSKINDFVNKIFYFIFYYNDFFKYRKMSYKSIYIISILIILQVN